MPPAAPSDLSASQINLNWIDNAGDESAYLVERSPTGNSNWSQIAGRPADSRGYSDTGLACASILPGHDNSWTIVPPVKKQLKAGS